MHITIPSYAWKAGGSIILAHAIHQFVCGIIENSVETLLNV